MTCIEARGFLDGNPLALTIAERTATAQHCRQCPHCSALVNQRAAAAAPRLTPVQRAAAKIVAALVHARDRQDAEAGG